MARFSPDGRVVAIVFKTLSHETTPKMDRNIVLRDVATGEHIRTLVGHIDEIKYLAFSPDGQTLASGMESGDIYLWETATGAKKKMLRGHSLRVSHIFFSVDGQTLISASDDGTMLIWDLRVI